MKRRSVKRNAKNARGLGKDAATAPFTSRARLIFALLVLTRPHYTVTILSESLFFTIPFSHNAKASIQLRSGELRNGYLEICKGVV